MNTKKCLINDEDIRDLHNRGISWRTIGKIAGLTPEGVRRRYIAHLRKRFPDEYDAFVNELDRKSIQRTERKRVANATGIR